MKVETVVQSQMTAAYQSVNQQTDTNAEPVRVKTSGENADSVEISQEAIDALGDETTQGGGSGTEPVLVQAYGGGSGTEPIFEPKP